MSNDPKIYKLKHPFTLDDKEITRIEFIRPKGKHIKGINLTSPTMDDMLKLAAKISGQLPRVYDEMDLEDVMAIMEIVGDFLGAGQVTG